MRLAFALALVLLITGCEKESGNKDIECQQLQSAFINADIDKVKETVTNAINRLPSQTHTQENLNALALALSNRCDITAEVLCYGCIKTLPEQSEIRLYFMNGNNIIHRTIDISATSITNDNMKFVAMHE